MWVNEVNFIDLYNWMILMGEQGGEIEKMNVRKSKKDKVNAQISVPVSYTHLTLPTNHPV